MFSRIVMTCGAADLLSERQQLSLFRREMIRRLGRFDVQAVVREIIEGNTD